MQVFPVLDIGKFRFSGNATDFYANKLSTHLRDHQQHIDKPHKHNSYLVVYFTKGAGIHEIDFTAYKVKAGSIFLLKPGQTHHWKLSDNAEGYIFLHTAEFYNQPFSHNTIDSFPFFYSAQNSPVIYLRKNEEVEIVKLFGEIETEYCNDLLLKYRKIFSLLDLLYIGLSRLYLSENSNEVIHASAYSIKLRQLEELIDANYVQLKLPYQYASLMNISAKHLNRITQSLLGKSTTDLITDRIMLEAKRMLSHSKNTVTEIATLLGYNDFSYFSRVFKSKSGMTPSAFAKQYH